jgi:hypothetical protein
MIKNHAMPPEWGRRRTRHDPPDVEEAVAAAQGLTDDIDSQVEIAAGLIGLPVDAVRSVVIEASAQAPMSQATTRSIPPSPRRTVTVERRNSRLSSIRTVQRHR